MRARALSKSIQERQEMDVGLFTAGVAAAAALLGSALGHWGAARLQTQRLAHEADRADAALLREQCERCLAHVLETRARVEALFPFLGELPKLALESGKSCAHQAAREAYAVALLYLDAARPAAKGFFAATAEMTVAFGREAELDEGDLRDVVSAWRVSVEALEDAPAALASDTQRPARRRAGAG